MMSSELLKTPPKLDAIVDQVLAYNPKGAKPDAKPNRRGTRSDTPDVLFSRRKKPPAKD